MIDLDKILREKITAYEPKFEAKSFGKLVSVGDGVISIAGLSEAMMAEIITLPRQTKGLVLNLGRNLVGAIVLGDSRHLKEGDEAITTGQVLSVPAGEALLGRVIDPLGLPLDGRAQPKTTVKMPLERIAPGVISREKVKQPVQTGISAIDAMIPIGRGQRELIIGDRSTGKSAIALTTIINQKKQNLICIYVVIGQKAAFTAQLITTLNRFGAMDHTIIVAANAAEPPALQFLAPYAGVAIAEYFAQKGRDVLVVYDDLTKHAWAYRELSLLLRRPSGREAYPGDVFYLHSRLLERACKLNPAAGGGSITALPIIETQAGDISAYIPTNVVSITDGQIYLETDLFNAGVRPAINAGLSVSRVGGDAQIKAMRQVAGKLRMELAQYRELAAFAQFASDLDEDTKKRIDTGRKYVELLKQTQNNPMPFYKQVVSIYGANNGLLDGTVPENVHKIEMTYQEFILRDRKDILDMIETERVISEEIKVKLDASITDFKEANGNLYVI